MSWDRGLDICRRALAIAGASGGSAVDGEVTVGETEEALLRFAENQPIAHTTFRRLDVSLRLRDGQRFGEARVAGDSDADLATLVARAREQADALAPEPELLPSAGPQALGDVPASFADATLDAYGPEARAAAVEALLRPVRRAGLRAAGICQNSVHRCAKATTNGMAGSYEATEVEWDLTVLGDDSTGRQAIWSRTTAGAEPERWGEEAVATCRRGGGPRDLEPGAYRTVLSADAVASLLWWIAGGFNARLVKEGQTWVATRRGQRVGPAGLDLVADAAHPLLLGQPFDGDGLALRPVTLLRDGVVGELCYDRRTAAEDGVAPTGWCGGGRNPRGASPAAIVLAGEDRARDELIAACGDGVYVERLWYANWIDPTDCSVTAMTRDGVFRIRDGRLAEPVRNLRVGQNLLRWLASIEARGRLEAFGSVAAPPVLAGEFTFSSGTTF